jgi:hypothetical protein
MLLYPEHLYRLDQQFPPFAAEDLVSIPRALLRSVKEITNVVGSWLLQRMPTFPVLPPLDLAASLKELLLNIVDASIKSTINRSIHSLRNTFLGQELVGLC